MRSQTSRLKAARRAVVSNLFDLSNKRVETRFVECAGVFVFSPSPLVKDTDDSVTR